MSDADAMVAWLREVHEADEQAARESMARAAGEWRCSPDELGIWPGYVSAMDGSTEYPLVTGAQSYVGDMINEGIGVHIARHDPLDTLARIAGERRIVVAYERGAHAVRRELGTNKRLDDPQYVAVHEVHEAHKEAVRALAWGYRHRGGWQEGWAP